MSARIRTQRPSRQLVTRDQIIAAALAIIDAQGLESCSLSAVAERLGVKAPSLYHHFSGRGELLRLVARQLFTALPLPRIEPETNWRNEIVRISRASRRAILSHPNAAPLLLELPLHVILADAYAHWRQLLAAKGVTAGSQQIVLQGLEKLTYGSALFSAAERRRRDAGSEGGEAAALDDDEEEAVFVETLLAALRGLPDP